MSSLSTLPKGDSAWLLRKSIQRIMQQVSVLETNIGSSTTGNSANTQVIFNDAGTLRGDAGLTYNKTTDTLSTGSATISGDLTVDTSTLKVDSANDRVGIGTASPTQALHVRGNILTGSAAGTDSFLNVTTDGVQNSLFGFNNSGSTNGYGASNNNTYVGSGNNYGLQIIGNSSVLASFSTSGVFNWYDGAGGTRMTLNSTGLGVGGSVTNKLTVTVTPPTSNSDGLVINGPSSRQIIAGITGATYSYAGVGANQNLIYGGNAQLNILGDNQNVRIGTSASSYLLLDTAGNCGIGVTPSAWATYKGLQVGYASLAGYAGSDTLLGSNVYFDGGAFRYISTATASSYRQLSGVHSWSTAPSGTAGNAITFTQAMTLDASGKLNLGVASPYNAARLTVQSAGGAGGISVAIQNDDDSYYAINFRNSSGTSCGSISCTTSSTSFNVSSDYRLKEAVQPLTGGLTRVNALKPSIYKWKVNGSTGEGFIAHELADVVPFAVTGDKDAVDADGKPSYQGVDLSKLVPILVAAIQELTARVQTLEAK